MRNIKNMHLESIMMLRGRKKVHLVNKITHLIESHLVPTEPCGAIMINAGERVLVIESKYYDKLRIFTIFIDEDRVVSSIHCDLSDVDKDRLFGDFDIFGLIHDTFMGARIDNGYSGQGRLTNYNPRHYYELREKEEATRNKIPRYVPKEDDYERILDMI